MDPSEARSLLLAQHERLRALLLDTEALARRFVAAAEVATALDRSLAELRAAFDEHNKFEASLLEPMLLETDAWGPARLARMVEEHTEEHKVFATFLARRVHEVAPEMPDFAEELLAHMEAEERTFLSPKVLRDDIVAVDGGADT
jgi:hypothetical protein